MNEQFLQSLIQWTFGITIVSSQFQHMMTQISSEGTNHTQHSYYDEVYVPWLNLNDWHLNMIVCRFSRLSSLEYVRDLLLQSVWQQFLSENVIYSNFMYATRICPSLNCNKPMFNSSMLYLPLVGTNLFHTSYIPQFVTLGIIACLFDFKKKLLIHTAYDHTRYFETFYLWSYKVFWNLLCQE